MHAVELLTNNLMHKTDPWRFKKQQQTEVAEQLQNLSHYQQRVQGTKLLPKGDAKKNGVTQQVRKKPQTHEQASQNYIIL